jgi:hypothetical protein
MIDFEKLKIAHELAKRYKKQNEYELSIEINFTETISVYILHIDRQHDEAFSNIDDLIIKLKELTQKELKMDESEECSHERLTVGCKVCDTYKDNPDDAAYKLVGDDIETKIASGYTTEALMILHLRVLEIERKFKQECQHKSDGKVHAIDNPIGDEIHGCITMKCIKCGELYK